MMTRSFEGSYCERSGLMSPKMLVRLSGGGVGLGLGVGACDGVAARTAIGLAPAGPLVGAEHAATTGSSVSRRASERFKRR
jgi:hypothetical protein